jgi:hypothetical protein
MSDLVAQSHYPARTFKDGRPTMRGADDGSDSCSAMSRRNIEAQPTIRLAQFAYLGHVLMEDRSGLSRPTGDPWQDKGTCDDCKE